MKRLITVGMAFGIVCLVASLAFAQSTEWKWKYGECPPGMLKTSQTTCSDVKDTFRHNLAIGAPTAEDQAKASKWRAWECPPGVIKGSQPSCTDVKDTFRPSWTADVSPEEDATSAFGQAPAWSSDGVLNGSGKTKCAKCGRDYPVNSRLKKLATQP